MANMGLCVLGLAGLTTFGGLAAGSFYVVTEQVRYEEYVQLERRLEVNGKEGLQREEWEPAYKIVGRDLPEEDSELGKDLTLGDLIRIKQNL